MASTSDKARKALHSLSALHNVNTLIENIKNKPGAKARSESLPGELNVTEEGIKKRLQFLLKETSRELQFLTGKKIFTQLQQLEGNIENYIGMSMVPTGIIGPVKVTGSEANGDFYIPLSTSEGTLIASYHRGAKACYLAGGATSICLVEGVQRSPLFKFTNLGDLGLFLIWLFEQLDEFKKITEESSRFAKLMDMKTNIEGNHLILIFEYHTGDAAGQNMVTLCTDEICSYIIKNAPVKPLYWFIESNYSGDKKATALSFSHVRGKKVTAEIILSKKIVKEVLKTTPERLSEYWISSTIGSIQSGSIGAQGHYANGLAALFLATGQDVACIAEAAVGITRIEVTSAGDLYASVTLPNLIVGTVGGGTGLPTQKECLELMDCYGTGKARKFAELCGALVLAGELSIAAALSAGHFTSAHKKFREKEMRSATLNNNFSKVEQNNSSFLKRFYIYQKERFPFLVHGLLVASFSFSAISYSRICRGAIGFVSTKTFLIGIFITISLFLLVRIFDEFKDAEDDARYRSELPVPRGLVSLRELGWVAVIIVALQVISILFFFPKMLVIYFIVIGYLLLMGKEFFISGWLKKHQFWYVTSHMFIIPLVDMYASGLDWKLEGVYPPAGLLFFFAVSYMNGIVLEIGRKIRIPARESEGVLTYSFMLGTNNAVVMWIIILLVTLGLSIAAGVFAGYGMAAFIVLGGVFIVCSLPAFIFLKVKSEKVPKYIEYASALWTIAMYLTLGGGPMISKLFFN